MLTPEFLNAIEFNKVVQLYNQLNIDIVADIIERVSQMQEITNTTKYQLKVLLQTNGTEIFNYTLQETSSLTAEIKKALKELFEEVGAEDIESYKELYEYRDVPYKLSETQYKILNQGLKVTNNTLKNLTNSIAFASKQAYVNTVDSAYMQAMSGAISYTKAIETAVQELANQGITLKDSLGRNVQLEVAVRRNVLAGIRDTARALDKDISDYLGCDGYEVTAHTGARPTHAAAQGKQYALTKEKAKEYNVGLWSDVVDLWSEYNCRHDYFGIILGISEPVYDNDELTEMENATVMYKGKEIPYYEATQKQRALENSIRKTKRSIQTLQKAGQDFTNQQTKLTKLQKQYTDFCNETGLGKEYSRLQVAKLNNKTYSVVKRTYYEDKNANRYYIDGKHVILDPTEREEAVANILSEFYQKDVSIIPKVNEPANIKTPDYIIDGEKFDLKQITGSGKYVIQGNIKGKSEQATNFIIDITKSEMNLKEVQRQVENIYKSKHYTWVQQIIIIKNNEILSTYK